jgi:site-specific DNA-methyltransferase (adenine-specific)
MTNVLLEGDCLELMKVIPDKSIDMVLADLPYQITACNWDKMIPLEPLWEQYKRIVKDNSAIVLTASQPFTSKLVMSNPTLFAHAWVWNKRFAGNFVQAKRQPLKDHEDVLVFCAAGKQPKYFPLMEDRDVPIKKGGNKQSKAIPIARTKSAEEFARKKKEYNKKYPTTTSLIFSVRDGRGRHPTQKPVALFEYLIKTYTNEGDLVLDNVAGSGTTAIACINTNRKYILMEKDPNYCGIIRDRIKRAKV